MPDADFLREMSGVPHRAADMRTLDEVIPENAGLSLAQKRVLVDQAGLLIGNIYAHLHLKKALYAIDPVQRLTLLQYRLDDPEDVVVQQELEFHRELLSIFHSLHDLHTNYVLPVPYQRIRAVLPFLIEEYFDEENQPHYLVTKVTADHEDPHFKPGAEVLLWNGLPIAEAIRRNGENESGSNRAARFAVGLRSLTIRSLALSLPPEEKYIRIDFLDAAQQQRNIAFQWLTLNPSVLADTVTDARLTATFSGNTPEPARQPDDLYLETVWGNNLLAEQINACRQHLYANRAEEPVVQPSLERLLETTMPQIIRAATLNSAYGELGYLRLYSFNTQDLQGYIAEIIRLLQLLPQQGLVLDLRGNPGGMIMAAEMLLQLFTPQPIQPELAQFRSDPLLREFCQRNSPSPLAPAIDFSPWVESLNRAHASGAIYSTGHPITDPELANSIGQVYTGPAVLITDAYCYSAADMFAAGFRDNNIGPILGVDENTGAGGANVWTHPLLKILSRSPHREDAMMLDGVFKDLPRNANFRVSSRRMLRVGDEAGMPLEDFGVEPDQRHYMTRNDILNGNEDLYHHAAQILVAQPRYQLRVAVDAAQCALRLSTLQIDRVDWFINGRAAGSLDISNNQAVIQLPASTEKRQVVLQGYFRGTKVAVAKHFIICEA